MNHFIPTHFIEAGATFSPDRMYRYRLLRRWSDGPLLMVIGLNPSTADEFIIDPTIRRCIGYAHRWGFSGLRMANLFAYRSTDPQEMLKVGDPVGPANLEWIITDARAEVRDGGMIVAAWGNHGTHRFQNIITCRVLADQDIPMHCLKVTKSGQPSHPLYLPKDLEPVLYRYDLDRAGG